MKPIFILSIVAFLFSAPAHDIPMGLFSLTFEEEHIIMDIKLEVTDVEKAVAKYYNKKSNDRLVEQYILKHTEWHINDVQMLPELCSTDKEQDHYLIKMNFHPPQRPLKNMTIVNECLIEEIDNHSNVIYIYQHGERRGFRLNKDRKQTTFELRE